MSKSNTSKPIRQDQPETLHVGVDLALEKNAVAVVNGNGLQLDRFHFPQNRGGFNYFFGRLQAIQEKYPATAIFVAMEPTNYFWKLLARELEERQIPYRLVNAYTVKKHREGNQLDTSKDDPRDAKQIAELSRTDHYTQTHLQQGTYEELRQYATLNDQLGCAIRREKHILWGLAGQVFPEVSQIFKDLTRDTSRALLMSCAAATQIRHFSEEEFIARVHAVFSGKRFGWGKLHRAYTLAATSIGLTEGLQAIQLAIQLHFSHLQVLEGQRKQVMSALTACLHFLPAARYLLSVPSLKPVSAALLLAETGDPSRYHSASEWVKLAGIQPTPNLSGKKRRSRTPMSHHGRARLRALMYFACLRMIQLDPHFAHLYAYLQKRDKNPLTKMQAVGALMNKLLRILWALVHNQTLYNPVPDFSV